MAVTTADLTRAAIKKKSLALLVVGFAVSVISLGNTLFGWFRSIDWLRNNAPSVFGALTDQRIEVFIIVIAFVAAVWGAYGVWSHRQASGFQPTVQPDGVPSSTRPTISVGSQTNQASGNITQITALNVTMASPSWKENNRDASAVRPSEAMWHKLASDMRQFAVTKSKWGDTTGLCKSEDDRLRFVARFKDDFQAEFEKGLILIHGRFRDDEELSRLSNCDTSPCVSVEIADRLDCLANLDADDRTLVSLEEIGIVGGLSFLAGTDDERRWGFDTRIAIKVSFTVRGEVPVFVRDVKCGLGIRQYETKGGVVVPERYVESEETPVEGIYLEKEPLVVNGIATERRKSKESLCAFPIRTNVEPHHTQHGWLGFAFLGTTDDELVRGQLSLRVVCADRVFAVPVPRPWSSTGKLII